MKTDPSSSRLSGVWSASLTALDDRLGLDIGRTIAHSRWLLDNGCDGVLLLGTTGEASSLGFSDRIALAKEAGRTLPPQRLMIGIGSASLADAVAFGKAALEGGCNHLLALPPYFYKGASEDGHFAFYNELIARLGDPRLRLFLYNIPKHSGASITSSLFARLLEAHPGLVAGVKDSSGDWASLERLILDFPGQTIFSGSERLMLKALRAGGAGCIAGTANALAPLLQRLYRDWRKPEADALQRSVEDARAVLEGVALVPALKALTARRTADRAWRNVLPPFVALTPASERALCSKLEAARFFDLVPEMKAA